MPSAWIEALKEWNATHSPGKWCVPRKGSAEHAQVRAIMDAKKGKKVEAPPPPKKKAAKMPTRTAEQEEGLRKAVEGYKAAKAKKEKVKEFLRKALEKRRAKKDGKKEVKIGGEVVVGTDEEIEEYRRLLAAAGGGEPEPEPEPEEEKPKPVAKRVKAIPFLRNLPEPLQTRLREKLIFQGDSHFYEKGLGYPLNQVLSHIDRLYRQTKPEEKDHKQYLQSVKEYIEAVSTDATWDGEPQKIVLEKDYKELFRKEPGPPKEKRPKVGPYEETRFPPKNLKDMLPVDYDTMKSYGFRENLTQYIDSEWTVWEHSRMKDKYLMGKGGAAVELYTKEVDDRLHEKARKEKNKVVDEHLTKLGWKGKTTRTLTDKEKKKVERYFNVKSPKKYVYLALNSRASFTGDMPILKWLYDETHSDNIRSKYLPYEVNYYYYNPESSTLVVEDKLRPGYNL